MPKLYVENGPDRGKSYVITKDGPFFAGRDSAAQVQILDEMASRRHFQIEFRDGAHHVRDLGSSNGTLLNGRPIKGVVPLSSNDRIQVGETNITFVDEKRPSIIGTEISGYRILDRVGRGGMGTVYRALQTSLDRVVALKILAPHLIENTNFVNLFIREARAAGALSHPNVVQVYDVGVNGDTYFFSMEYIPHGTVEDLINKEGALPLDQSLRILRDAAIGLQYAEQKGIIHRDIKPGNLMVGAEGIVKIGDLGIARSTEGAGLVSQKDGVSGSPHYIAPEQARGQDIDHRVDIYALGVSLYQMLSAKTPYSGSTPREVILKHIKEPAPRLSERVPDCPDEVVRLVHRMMAKDPDHRPESATALLADLEPLLETYTEGDSRAVALPAGGKAKKIFILLGIGILAAGLLVGGMVLYRNYQKQQEVIQQTSDRWDDTLNDCRKRFASIRGTLDNEQLAGVESGIADIRARLTTLEDAAAPSEDLQTRHDTLVADLNQAELDIARVRVAREATTALDEILEGQPTERSDPAHLKKLESVLEKLEKFEQDFAQRDGAQKELKRADEHVESMQKRISSRIKYEKRIENNLTVLRGNVEGWLGSYEWDRAMDALEDLPEEERFGSFKATWEGLREQILASLQDQWNQQVQEIDQHLADGEPEKAERIVSRFVAKSTRLEGKPVRAEILVKAEQVRAANATSSAAPEENLEELLSESLSEAWMIWLDDFTPGSYRAGEVKKALLRHQDRLPEMAPTLARHLEFLSGWQAIRATLAENVQSRAVEVGRIGNADNLTVTEINFRSTKIKLRTKTDSILTRSFDKLKREELARILCAAARTATEHVYAGFWAHLVQNSSAGDGSWAIASQNASTAAEVAELRKLLDSRP